MRVCVYMLAALVCFLFLVCLLLLDLKLFWLGICTAWYAQCTCKETFQAIHPHYFILILCIYLFISHSFIHSKFQNPCLIFIYSRNAFALFMLIRFWCSLCPNFNQLSKSKWAYVCVCVCFSFFFVCPIWMSRSK